MSTCPECGARVPDGGACVDLFHAMLLLEQEVMNDPAATAGGRGELAHFYAVSTYMLQHPESMGYSAEALAGLRRGIAEQLSGRMSLEQWRRTVRRNVNGSTRVLRRSGDAVIRWPVSEWPINVTNVLEGGVADYTSGVAAWADSVVRTLDEAGA